MPWSPKPKGKNRSCCWTTSSTNSTPGGSNSSSGWSGRRFRTDLHHRLQPDASAHHSGQNRLTTTRSSRSKTEESCDETKQDGHRRRTARRIFPASLRRRQSRRRTAARHLGARSSVRQPTPKPPSCGSKITFCTSASVRAFCATNFLPARSLGRRNQPPARKSDWSMRSSSGEIHLFSSWRLYNSRQILALFKEKMYFAR